MALIAPDTHWQVSQIGSEWIGSTSAKFISFSCYLRNPRYGSTRRDATLSAANQGNVVIN